MVHRVVHSKHVLQTRVARIDAYESTCSAMVVDVQEVAYRLVKIMLVSTMEGPRDVRQQERLAMESEFLRAILAKNYFFLFYNYK